MRQNRPVFCFMLTGNETKYTRFMFHGNGEWDEIDPFSVSVSSCCWCCSWSLSFFIRQTSEGPKLCSSSCSPCSSTCPRHSNTQTSLLVARQSSNFLQDCMNMFQRHHLLQPCLSHWPSTFFLFVLFAPVPTTASSKFHSVSERRKVIVLSFTLVLLSGTHCHCTSETLQLLTLSSLL